MESTRLAVIHSFLTEYLYFFFHVFKVVDKSEYFYKVSEMFII